MSAPTRPDPPTRARTVGRRWLAASGAIFVLAALTFVLIPPEIVDTYIRLVQPASAAWFCLGVYFNRRGYVDDWRDRDRRDR